MNKTFLARSNLYKCAEFHKPCYLAQVHCARLGVNSDCIDNFNGSPALVGINTRYEYLAELAVLFNVDFNLALSLNFLDNLTVLADNLADFLGRNCGGEHLGSVR